MVAASVRVRRFSARLGERGVTPRTVYRNAQQLRSQLTELRKHLVVECHLIATYRTPVRGIERQDDRAPTEFGQAEHLVGRGMEDEVRGRRPG